MEKEQMRALLQGTERVVYRLARFKIYESLYTGIPITAAEVVEFRRALTELYVFILQFLARSSSILGKRVWERAITSFNDEMRDFEQQCSKLEANVEIAAHNCDRLVNENQTTQLWTLLSDLSKQKAILYGIGNKVSRLFILASEEKIKKILEWTSNIPYLDNHIFACQKPEMSVMNIFHP